MLAVEKAAESEEEKEDPKVSSGQEDEAAPAAEAATAAAAGGAGAARAAPEEEEELWTVDPEMDGVQVMADAFVRSLQPSLDATIQRIEELRSNQKARGGVRVELPLGALVADVVSHLQDLLQQLVDQNAAVTHNKQLEDVAVVMDKLPHYFAKVQMIRAAMTEISASVDRMKRRAESLRVDAQSRTWRAPRFRHALVGSLMLTCLPCRRHQEGEQARRAEPVEQAGGQGRRQLAGNI